MSKVIAKGLFWWCLMAASTAFAQPTPEITISGADNGLASNIRSHLRIGGETCDTALVRLERLRPQMQGNIQRAAQALGYYRLSAEAEFSRDENCWQLDLTVIPGERILVNEVSINLPEDPQIQEIFRETLEDLPMLPGLPLNHGQYESVKNALSAAAVENGFFSARFSRSEILVNLAEYTADIVIDFDTGNRFRFGVIRVLPVPGFSQAFLESMVTLRTGSPYSSEELLNQRVLLDGTQYFRQISITPQVSSTNNLSVPVIIELTPRLQHSWSTGIGFTTDTGPRVRAAYENRYINGRGHSLNSNASISAVRSQLNLGYKIPLDDPLTTSLNFTTGVVTEDTDTYDSDRFKLEAAYVRESSSGWVETYSVDYLLDDYVLDQQSDKSQVTMLGYSLSKTAGDDFINPSRGWRLFGQVRGASDSVVSDATFLQLYTSGKGVISFGNTRLITRFELGTTLMDDIEELPASVRYFAGGDQSIRGYDYRSLGPINQNGEVIGGKHIVTGSMEYDFPVRGSWRGAVFYDGGNAFATEKLEWKNSVGFGARWISPIGPIRVDFAHALEGDKSFRLHITMGPDL